MSPMDKVALDLYAISQGTQKLFGDEGSETDVKTDEDPETTTLESSTGNYNYKNFQHSFNTFFHFCCLIYLPK